MGIFGKRWEPDGRDTLSPAARMALSIAITAFVAFLLEYAGTRVWGAYYYTSPSTFYIVIAIFAFGLGPVLVLMRRWSILVPMVIVGGSMMILELFNHYVPIEWIFADGAFVPDSVGARVWDWEGGHLFGITNPLLIAVVAGIIETIVVPVSVGLQKLLTAGLRRKDVVRAEEYEELFRDSVVDARPMKPRRDFGFYFLRIAGIAFAVYLGYIIVSLIVGGRDLPLAGMFFLNPATAINTFGKLAIMTSLAAISAFNVRIRREALLLLAIAHVIAVGASLWLYLAYPANPLAPEDHQFILTSAIVDGALLILLVALYFKYRSFGAESEDEHDLELSSPAATAMRLFFLACGIGFTALLSMAVLARIFARPGTWWYAVFGGPDPLVINTTTKFGTMAALSFLLYAKPRLRPYFIPTLVIVFGITAMAALTYAIVGPSTVITRSGDPYPIPWYAPLDFLLNILVLSAMLGIRRMQYHVDYRITSLRPSSAECVMALHDAVRESSLRPELSRREVLQRIDEYIVGIHGRRRGLIGFPFFLLEHLFTRLYLLPSFSDLAREEARWMLRSRMLRPRHERMRAAIPPLADAMFMIGDILHSLVTLAFFSSKRGQEAAGYVLPDARERLQPAIAADRPPNGAWAKALPMDGRDPIGKQPLSDPIEAARLLAPRLGVPSRFDSFPTEVDYCIIGSGAAGGVIAYRLAKQRGRDNSICVLEQGSHFGAGVDFNDDEMRMVRMLYSEGGLQVTRSFDFTILQGECVGGTTVINNAVCFRMPEPSRREWGNLGFDLGRIDEHYDRVAQEINISVLTPESVNRKVEERFAMGVNGYNASLNGGQPLSAPGRVSGNFSECLGCGLCNIGCRRMRKLSVLETYLPWAQAHGVQVLANTGAVRCEYSKNGARKKIERVVARKPDGTFGAIRVKKGVIVAAGAIASSRFLLRSDVGGPGVGRGVSCNFALPTLVQFDETLDAFDGLQITMFAAPESYYAIFETTFNPPGAYAIVHPQYFERHRKLMDAYRHSVNFGALVGSDPNGSVDRDRSILFGRAIQWSQSPRDIANIKSAITTMVRFAKEAGARRILLPTLPVLDIPLDGDTDRKLDAFNRMLNEAHHFNFATAHPQGGNKMAGSMSDDRVVDLDFRVRDCENLYLCDASVFPGSIRVNPQWTIMALASQAGERIAAG